MQTRIQTTADGSHTLFVPDIGESCHSMHGAIQESTFVFIEQGLRICLKSSVRILEIGFGTGLNALLTALEADRTQTHIYYTTLEKYPLPIQNIRLLNYPKILEDSGELFDKIHSAPWEIEVAISPFFVLHKVNADFTTYTLTEMYDVIFFDAFSHEKQPEMWSEAGFRKIIEHCNPDAVFTTYCAKGSVRRALQKVGFLIERLPGPSGKREILRGIRNHTITN